MTKRSEAPKQQWSAPLIAVGEIDEQTGTPLVANRDGKTILVEQSKITLKSLRNKDRALRTFLQTRPPCRVEKRAS